MSEYTNTLIARIAELEKQCSKLRSVLNEFDNPYQVGDAWQWQGPDPDEVDEAMRAK